MPAGLVGLVRQYVVLTVRRLGDEWSKMTKNRAFPEG